MNLNSSFFILPSALLLLASTAAAANLVPNSSFECGPGRGWISYGDGNESFGHSSSMSGHLSSTAFHGLNSYQFGTRLLSRVFYLAAGTYTVSCYMRAPSSVTCNYGIMDSARETTVPANSAAVTNGWARFSASRTITTNGFYTFKAYHLSSSDLPLIDAIQVETGAVATAYAPMHQVEMGLDTAEANNLLLSADTKQFRLRFYNDGSATSATGEYKVYSYLNALLGSGRISQPLAASNTTVSVNLPALNGYMRITSRLFEFNDSWDETAITVLPYAVATTQDTNLFLGTHPNYSDYSLARERRSGIGFARDLSPALGARWSIIEPTEGNFVWNDLTMSKLATNGMVPLCNLFPGTVPEWPTWATNGDGSANFLAYSNFCFRTVARYSAPPYNIHYWETLNEPQAFVNGHFPVLTNLDYQTMLTTQSVAAIKLADPAAYIVLNTYPHYIGPGVQVSDYNYAALWTNLPTYIQDMISAISVHVYPQDTDPNASAGEVNINQVKKAVRELKPFRPVWNTETGAWSVGNYKTLNSLLQANYSLFGTVSSEWSRNEKQQRNQWTVDQSMYNALRSLGWGCAVYLHYWSKAVNDATLDASPTDPTIVEYNNVEKPLGVAILMTKVMAGVGLGNITNSAATSLDAFVFTNALGTSIAVWNFDRTLKTLTFTNSNFALYDVMGNQLQTNTSTAKITRTPQYIVSGTLSTAQLSNTVKYASVAALDDTTPPNVAFDVAPSGNWEGSDLPLVKWSAFDEHSVPFTGNAETNLAYKWKLDGGAYSTYSQSNHVLLAGLANGNHTVYVTAKDAAGNEGETSYSFAAGTMFTNRIEHGRRVKSGNRKP